MSDYYSYPDSVNEQRFSLPHIRLSVNQFSSRAGINNLNE